MTRTFTQLFIIALVVISSFSACVKTNDSLSLTIENLAGTYTLTSQVEKVSGRPAQDVTQYNDPCELDDQTILRTDLSATYVDAGTKCSAVDSWTDAWSFNGNVLIIAGDEYTVRSLTKTTLVIEQSNSLGTGVLTTTYTYRKY